MIGTELGRLHADGISADELERAKESVKGRMVLSSESTGARMSRIGRSVLFDTPLLTLDEMIAKVDAVTVDDVAELADEFYSPEKLSAAAIAPDEDRFRAALAPVSEALAAPHRLRRAWPIRSESSSPAPPGAWGRPSARRSRPPTAWSWPAKADPELATPPGGGARRAPT